MAYSQDDIVRLIHKVEGEAELQSMTRTLEEEIAKLRQLDAALKAGTITQTQYAAASAQTRTQAEAAAGGVLQATQALRAAGGGAQAASRGFLEFSRGVEDFTTGGPIGLLNNIPGLFQSIGSAVGLSATAIGGLTAGVSLLATAAYIAYQNSDKIAKTFGLGATETEADRMEDLAAKTHKTATETAELNKYKREQGEIEAMLRDQSKATKDQASAVQAAFAEAGPEKVKGALMGQRIDRAGGMAALMTPEERGSVEFWERQVAAMKREGFEAPKAQAEADKERAKASQRILAEEAADAEKAMARAKTDPLALQTLIGRVKETPGAFPKGFETTLGAASAEEIAARERVDQEAEASTEAMEASDKAYHENQAHKKRILAARQAQRKRVEAEDARNTAEATQQAEGEDRLRQEEQRAEAKAAAERRKANKTRVEGVVKQFGGAVLEDLTQGALLKGRMDRKTANDQFQVERKAMANIAGNLRRQGVGQGDAEGAALAIVRKARQELDAKLAEQQQMLPALPGAMGRVQQSQFVMGRVLKGIKSDLDKVIARANQIDQNMIGMQGQAVRGQRRVAMQRPRHP